eukprot:13795991-Alexandrium_andersonii.AAC.1
MAQGGFVHRGGRGGLYVLGAPCCRAAMEFAAKSSEGGDVKTEGQLQPWRRGPLQSPCALSVAENP